MNEDRQERELRALFARLREEDAEAAPEFSGMMARARETLGNAAAEPTEHPNALQDLDVGQRPRAREWMRARRWAMAGSLLAAAAISGIAFGIPEATNDARFEELVHAYSTDPGLGGWSSPTDGLLNVPGRELLTSIPKVGGGRLGGSLLPPISGIRQNEDGRNRS